MKRKEVKNILETSAMSKNRFSVPPMKFCHQDADSYEKNKWFLVLSLDHLLLWVRFLFTFLDEMITMVFYLACMLESAGRC